MVVYIFSGNTTIVLDQQSEIQILYREELHNLSGLLNEVISSAEGRIVF